MTNTDTDSRQPLEGLSSAEVAQRVAEGAVNVDSNVHTRSFKQILFENIVTLFNILNVVLMVLVLFTGSFKNALFMGVIVINCVIGIVQEVRSKKTTDKLSIVAAHDATVIRDGAQASIPLNQIVRDDIVILGRGDQIPADAVVVQGACQVNESLLTGESDLVKKQVGDQLMSGSFVNAGTVHARVEHVGSENYASQISAEAKKHKKVSSEIMRSLNGIIKFVSIVIVPLGIALFAREVLTEQVSINSAILSTVAALISMIPEGLFLLTSTVLAVSVIRLAKSQVLVQQLYCIETLARVDTLCLDKTGTITTGAMEVSGTVPVPGGDQAELDHALASIVAADEDPNETARAIIERFSNGAVPVSKPVRSIAFSSDKKWSGAVLADGGAYVMGAAQFVMGDGFAQVADQAAELAADARILLVARVDGFTDEGDIKGAPRPVGFACIHDQIRSTAAQTIGYFKDQGVTVNVISGDDPRTVAGIAHTVGVPGADDYVDATTLATEADIDDAVGRYHVFGRVKPEQKKAFVVALQKRGHIVAMTGDGVNDTLALKQADCGVAMAAGSDAARNVAQLVLVDNNFASMPKVVAEGRRSINNLQRSASLFLTKTLLSITLAVLFIILPWQYPFQPIQSTLISMFTIGLPSFVLALEPNHERVRGHFMENVITRSLPGALTCVLCIMAANWLGYVGFEYSYPCVSTLCVLLTSWVGFLLVVKLSRPLTPIRAALIAVVAGGTILGATVFGGLFAIHAFDLGMWLLFIFLAIAAAIMFQLFWTICDRVHAKRLAKAA